MAMNQAINFLNSQPDYSSPYSLVVRQHPAKARLCSFKEKVDRRPIDPPPIVELLNNSSNDDFLQNPYFFLYATLTDASGKVDLHYINGNKTTAGAVVQSLHKLKDLDDTDGGFFVFSDISVRLEGIYRLRFTLFGIEGESVHRLCSTLSKVFQVYSPKSFPGMSESTFLTRCLSDQGVRIRIRKEPRSAHTSLPGKRRRGITNESEEDNTSSTHKLYIEQHHRTSPLSYSASSMHDFYTENYQQSYPLAHSTSSPGMHPNSTHDYNSRSTIPPPQLFRSSAMSMQNILSNDRDQLYHIPSLEEEKSKENRLLTTRKLPLPLPSSAPDQRKNSDYPHTRQHDINVLLNTDQQVLAWSSKDQFLSHLRK
ncbi:unnamed protein product [Rhizopus stolonifer]